MPKRRCCPECFDDRGLREQIFPFLGPEHGTCSFCGTHDVDLLEPLALAPFFGLVVNVYERSENGKSLTEWMKEDWQLFSHPAMDVAQDGKRLMLAPDCMHRLDCVAQHALCLAYARLRCSIAFS